MTKPPEKKTLRLQDRPKSSGNRSKPAERVRSGARARQVALQQRENTALPDSSSATDSAEKPSKERSRRSTRNTSDKASRKTATGRSGEGRAGRPGARSRSAPAGRRANVADQRHSHLRKPQASAAKQEHFTIFVPCPRGLEKVLVQELLSLGFADVAAASSGCRLQTDWIGILRLNLHSRIASRVLVQVAQARCRSEDDILELARQTEWERWFGPEHSLRVDTSAVNSPMRSLQYCNLRAKDGICDRLRTREGARPNIDTVRPDARVHLFLDAMQATLYLDVSGESLFKRGWRMDKGVAPLRENLAAGLLALSGWKPEAALMDPFCGSGTILLEAAWQALRVPPGIQRPFGFERLRNHQSRVWQEMKDQAMAQILKAPPQVLIGTDHDPAAIAAAQANAERARLGPDTIRFEVQDALSVRAPASTGWIISNPPYGNRLQAEEESFWSAWGLHLKEHFAGWQVHLISNDETLPAQLRFSASQKLPVYNGALACRFYKFAVLHKNNG